MITGKQLNNLCKTLNAVSGDGALGHDTVIDVAHVCMLSVRNPQPFGVSDSRTIDLAEVLRMKIEDSDFEPSIENGQYVLTSEDTTYRFKLGDDAHQPKVPKLEFDSTIRTTAKRFLGAVEKCNRVNDNAHLEGGRLHAHSEKTGTDVSIAIADADDIDDYLGAHAVYPIDHLMALAKVMVGDVVLRYGPDHPLAIEWNDGTYSYRALLAPRIEC